jgi:hypothetical protein
MAAMPNAPAQPNGAVRRMKAPREGQIMSERFERHRQPWRSDEVAKLKTLASKGKGLKEIAKALGRTEESTKERARIDGVGIAKKR